MADLSAGHAESVFRIGRAVERADGASRILDVHLQLVLEDEWVDEDRLCRSLLAVLGSTASVDHEVTRAEVVGALGVDRHDDASIAHAVGAAREHARRARDVVPVELWEGLDATRARMPRKVASDKVHEFLAWVRERSALAVGVVESATSRDDVWRFFLLGRAVERADLTARLLAASAITEAAGPTWTTVLRSCGAHEAYLRRHREPPTARGAAEFVLLDPVFPRSVLFSLDRAQQCIRDIGRNGCGVAEPDGRGPLPDGGDARSLLRRIRTSLESAPLGVLLDDLPVRMEHLRRGTAAVADAVRAGYFPSLAGRSWAGRPV